MTRSLRSASARGQHRTERDPQVADHWTGPSALLDIDDLKLRTFAHSLVRTCLTERDRALAVYQHVRRIPLAAPIKLRLRSARAVMDRNEGDAVDKATLFVALLRAVGLPARVLFASAYRGVLRGLPVDVACLPRPIVEVCIQGRWVRTDTYIFDDAYVAAARYRLQKEREDYGYGLCANGAVDWDGLRHAYLLGVEQEDEFVMEGTLPFDDALAFARSQGRPQRLGLLAKLVYWDVFAPRLDRVLRTMRARQPRPARKKSKGPRRSSRASGTTPPPAAA